MHSFYYNYWMTFVSNNVAMNPNSVCFLLYYSCVPVGLCKDGGSQCQRDGGAGHAGRGRSRNTTGCFQEDLPHNECPRLLKCESSFTYMWICSSTLSVCLLSTRFACALVLTIMKQPVNNAVPLSWTEAAFQQTFKILHRSCCNSTPGSALA